LGAQASGNTAIAATAINHRAVTNALNLIAHLRISGCTWFSRAPGNRLAL